ncbi:hypothetical protein [Egbenema bharatensis]|uniref:hypothetical protein n=1 Tax=Egbenema bharatensis TaxID=3463334 RepID=UPI003A8875F4
MLVTDLEYFQVVRQSNCIEGGASTYAEADAVASHGFAAADARAAAEGDRTRVRTKSSAKVSSYRVIDYSLARSSSVATARTGQTYSFSVDYAVDFDVSRNY